MNATVTNDTLFDVNQGKPVVLWLFVHIAFGKREDSTFYLIKTFERIGIKCGIIDFKYTGQLHELMCVEEMLYIEKYGRSNS